MGVDHLTQQATSASATSAPKRSKVEAIKEASQLLREPLATELKQDTTHFSEPAIQILKFHGVYQQDDRDARQERRQAGLERDYSMMLRTRVPGGVVPPQLYLTLDELADRYGNGTLRTTTRQAFQLHGILKQDLKTVLASIITQMGSTLSACGDVNRNVMAPVAPYKNRPDYVHAQTWASKLADVLTPEADAYYELWVDGERVPLPEDPQVKEAKSFVGNGVRDPQAIEPLYGSQFLPRKFKCAIGIPAENTVDIYSQDIGLLVVTDPKNGKLMGFNILVGGGLGRAHNKDETEPLLAQKMAFATPDEVLQVVQAILAVQRDHGNRHDRKQARMKYLVRDWGIRKFRDEVEWYFGQKLKRWRVMPAFNPPGFLGWRQQGDGKLFLGLFIENGRISDTPERQLKTALKQITERFGFEMRVTPTQDLILVDIDPAQRGAVDAILQEHGVLAWEGIPALVREGMACPALPTCGLAIAESERALPGLLRRLDELLQELGLGQESFVVRMTGCPNGCARPYLAEVGLVGTLPDHYQLWLAGSPRGDRLARVFAEKVHIAQVLPLLRALLLAFRQERFADESFGDFCHRVGFEALQARLDPTPVAVSV